MKRSEIILLFCFLLIAGCNRTDDKSIRRVTAVMGTTLEIQTKDFERDSADKLISAAFEEARRISNKYSSHSDTNYLWRLNNLSDTVIIDDETHFLFEKCEKYYKSTKGRFDPAVGNIVKMLGFDGGEKKLLTQNEIQNLLKHTGWKNVIFDDSLLSRKNDVKINLSAIAKGYAVDRVAKILESGGINCFLINAGGEIKTKGNRWNIGIQNPRKKSNYLYSILLENFAVATSGDYEQYIQRQGKKFSHIIDPVTGRSADKCISVTVIADSCIDADALATGIFVLGAEGGIGLIESIHNTECLVINHDGEQIFSSGFDKFIVR